MKKISRRGLFSICAGVAALSMVPTAAKPAHSVEAGAFASYPGGFCYRDSVIGFVDGNADDGVVVYLDQYRAART